MVTLKTYWVCICVYVLGWAKNILCHWSHFSIRHHLSSHSYSVFSVSSLLCQLQTVSPRTVSRMNVPWQGVNPSIVWLRRHLPASSCGYVYAFPHNKRKQQIRPLAGGVKRFVTLPSTLEMWKWVFRSLLLEGISAGVKLTQIPSSAGSQANENATKFPLPQSGEYDGFVHNFLCGVAPVLRMHASLGI